MTGPERRQIVFFIDQVTGVIGIQIRFAVLRILKLNLAVVAAPYVVAAPVPVMLFNLPVTIFNMASSWSIATGTVKIVVLHTGY